MYNSYMLYQAERPRTAREQREEDVRAGQLAAEFARLWHGLRHGLGRGGARHADDSHDAGRHESLRPADVRPSCVAGTRS